MLTIVQSPEEVRAAAGDAPLSLREWGAVAALGVCGYYLASYFDFAGLVYITASLERLLLFVYPTFAVLLSMFLFGDRLGRREVGALCLSYAGIALAFVGEGEIGGSNLWAGGALILLAALTYATYLVFADAMIARVGTNRLIALALTFAGLAVATQFVITRPVRVLLVQPWQVYAYSLAIALLSTVAPTFLLGQGIQRIGASRAAITGTIGPVATIVLGVVVLGEPIGPFQVIGAVLVLGGVVAL